MHQEFDRKLFSDSYVESPRKPDNFDLQVMEITGGRGRVVWGQDLFIFRNGNPNAVKYPTWGAFGPDRWIFEAWRAPFCTEAEWEAARYRYFEEVDKTIDMTGPYPHNGIWGMVMPLVDMSPDNFGGYIPCSEAFLEWLRFNHQAWEKGPQGKTASLVAYNQMMDELDAEEKLRKEETERRVALHSEWVHAHEAELNAEPTRVSVILTPNGQPWRKHADISANA
jgi:hypothetical protein